MLTEAIDFAATLANGPTFAHAMTKRMLHQEWNMSLETAIEAEAQAQALCMQTEDFRRAYRALQPRPSRSSRELTHSCPFQRI